MSYARTVVNRPVAVLVFFAALIGLGVFTLQRLSVDLFPEVEPPILVVRSSYDAGPEEVEEYVTRPLEQVLANVSGIDTMESTSEEGQSTVVLEFGWDVDLTEATNEVRDRLEQVADVLPDEAGSPQIFKIDPSSEPIMTIAITGNRDTDALREIADERIAGELEKVDGVGQATVAGGRDEIVEVRLLQSALEAYGFTVNGVATQLARQNVDVSGGELPFGEQRLLLRSIGTFTSLEEIRATVVGYVSGGEALSAVGPRPVRLDEIADVEFAWREPESLVTVDGGRAVTISIVKESGTNTVEVADAVRAALAAVVARLPEGVTVTVTEDSSTAVEANLSQVTSSMLIGAAFGVMVLFVFLRNVRAAAIIGVSIPASVVITFLAMFFGGYTLNMFTMSGLVIAIGMIVDSSIVVLEHIFTMRERGLPLKEAAMRGTSEMLAPITASALTTVSVFLPLIIFRDDLGIIGILFGDIAFVVIVAILASLAVAAALVPALATRWIPIRSRADRGERRGPLAVMDRALERGFGRLETGYAAIVRVLLRHRAVTLATTVALLIVVVSLVPSLGLIFSPPSAEDVVSATVEFRQGTPVEVGARRLEPIAEELAVRVPHLKSVVVTSGTGTFGTAPNVARITATLPQIGEREIDTEEVTAILRELLDDLAGTTVSFGRNRGRQLSGSDPIDVAISGDDLDAVMATARAVRDLLERSFPMVTEPSLNVEESAPELRVAIDRARAADLGVSIQEVSSEVRAAVEGVAATRYERAGSEFDVFVQLRPADRDETPDLERIFVTNARGVRVPVANVATLEYATGPTAILRENEIRTVHVTGGLTAGYQVSEVQPQVEAAIAATVRVPDGVALDYSGELSEIAETMSTLGTVILVAVLLVFALMAGQFESFRMPLIIFITIPLLIIGVVLLYWLLGEPFSVFSLVGIVVLVGVVVNNGIVLVDYTNRLRRHGMEPGEAIVEAARTRLRPILMTTLTTVLGLVPLAFFPGEGAQLTQPVGMTGVGGLLSSATLTLFVVPVLYSLLGARTAIEVDEHPGDAVPA